MFSRQVLAVALMMVVAPEMSTGHRLKPNLSPEEAASDRPARSVTIKAYWLRHGQSCANILKMFWTYRDPSLTDCGIFRAEALGPRIWHRIHELNPGLGSPLVFSSSLVRSMETALHNFDKKAPGLEDDPAFAASIFPPDVYPIPYIAESNPQVNWGLPDTPDNTPRTWPEQWRTKLHVGSEGEGNATLLPRGPNTEEQLGRIRFEESINPKGHPNRANSFKSSYSDFLQEFPWTLAQLLPLASSSAAQQTEIPVIIVSHSGYMKEHLDCGHKEARKPKNNEVWVQKYEVELPDATEAAAWTLAKLNGETAMEATEEQRARHTMTDVPGSCAKIFEDSFFPDKPPYKCEAGFQRCSLTNRPSADGECQAIAEQARVCGGA